MLLQWFFNVRESQLCAEAHQHTENNQRDGKDNMTNTSKRHIKTDKRTTIRLETAFWNLIDRKAEQEGQTWKQWAMTMLSGKPEGVNAASWLRVCSIQGEGKV